MTVICSIPVQIPVHRMRVTVRCLATGGPVHTATLRLMDYWGDEPEPIAEVLGLPIPYTEKLIADLQRGGEPVEREFVVWVDNARGQILPHTALTGVAVKPIRGGPYTLGVEPPLTADALTSMGLQAGLSWDLGLEGYVEVLDITQIVADIRSSSLPHLLRLPDTQLVISTQDDDSGEEWQFAVTQHGIHDPQLTAWAQTNYTRDLNELLDESHLLPKVIPPSHLTELTGDGQWQNLHPHPGELREQIAEAADTAHERVVLCAPDLRHVPAWLQRTLEEVADRDVQVVICPGDPGHVPDDWRFAHTTTPLESLPPVLSLIADEDHAVIHSDPDACLERSSQPRPQAIAATRRDSATARLLDRFGLDRLRRRPPTPKLTPEVIAQMLRQDLARLRAELPPSTKVEIHPADEKFAIETLDRHPPRQKPTQAARKAAAGIAWERILIQRVVDLSAKHQQLTITAERWKPPKVNLDLDVIVHDREKSIVWILDAKNSKRSDDQIKKMRDQIRLLKGHHELTHDCPTIMGVIVHHRNQLTGTPQTTEHHDILRCTLQGLGDLLLAKRLPGERAHTKSQDRKAA